MTLTQIALIIKRFLIGGLIIINQSKHDSIA